LARIAGPTVGRAIPAHYPFVGLDLVSRPFLDSRPGREVRPYIATRIAPAQRLMI
jgi:hypothetical protein